MTAWLLNIGPIDRPGTSVNSTNISSVTSQKSESLNHTAAEARSLSDYECASYMCVSLLQNRLTAATAVTVTAQVAYSCTHS
jgi:hypothetical protein